MMRRYRAVLRPAVACGITLLSLTGCDHGSKLIVTPQLLAAYESMARPVANTATTATIDCYVDFSLGMVEGMKATATINEKLQNFLGGRQVTCHKVGASADPPAITLGSPEANFLDQKNFTEAGSRLKVAIDRMTARKNGASLFITDFERVEDVALRQTLPGSPAPHPIDASAWAQNEFRDWLLAGNRIDVFAVPYQKPDAWFDAAHKRTYPNWIYTIVLTPRAIARDSSAMQSSVAGFLLEEYRKVQPTGARHFEFDADAFHLAAINNGDNADANKDLVVQDKSTETFAKGYEYYAFTSGDLVKFASDAAQSDKRIVTVRVSSQVPFLSDVAYGIKVSDVTQPLTDLDRTRSQGAPEVKTDVETGKADTTANKPVAIAFSAGTPVTDVFDFVYNPQTREFGVKLKPNFAGAPEPVVYKIDVVVASTAEKDATDADAVLSLQYAGGYRIRSLGESLRLAVRDVTAKLDGKVLHTFYIDLTP